MAEHLQVTTAAASRDEAESIAKALVERHLAGCVQILGPTTSVYHWQVKIEQAAEWLCLIKTTSSRYAEVERTIRELHSYECPEIIATPIEVGSDAYLGWLDEQTRCQD
jgi:periplasmic divalent cation tolerance protein